MLDRYCERGGEIGLWAEPVNALTNLAFLIAAGLAARRFVGTPGLTLRTGWDLALLILLLIAIGIGSALWHTFATRWALLADVIPITGFINLYLLSFGYRVLALYPWTLFGLWLAYQGANIGLLALVPAAALNGSVGYLPALAFLIGFWVWLRGRGHPLAPTMLAAAGLFGLSLTLRTLDPDLCMLWPIGTHFVWHLFNAWLLYLLLDGLIRHGKRARGAA
ncbi:MAG: hypothetical protein EA400_16195 [Chromatiaceae bacterium]|nr:MAG: hypothetical protein EA400_16195 [Chromatiaceae bacterium]